MGRRFGITIDCIDPLRLARFWRQLLDYVDDPPPPGYDSWAEYDKANGVSDEQASGGATILDPDGVGPRIYFQRVPERKSVKNRVHLDVPAGNEHTRDELRRTIEGWGGAFVRNSADPEDPFVVMTDPEGNEFCLT